MKKIRAFLVLFICLAGEAKAQDLSPGYIARSKDFFTYLKQDKLVSDSAYILSWAMLKTDSIFSDEDELDSAKPWVCYDASCLKPATDTVKLAGTDMVFIKKQLNAKPDTIFVNKLAASIGLKAGKPEIGKDSTSFELVTVPLFFQHNTVCILYHAGKSLYGRSGGFLVFKKSSRGWKFITDMYHFIEG